MKVSLLQMDMKLGDPRYNWEHAEEMIRKAAGESPDIICLPELWDVGFFPKTGLEKLADWDGTALQREMGGLAAELGVNIAAGSAAVRREDGIYNTAFFFNRSGKCEAAYDKVHLFSPMEEHHFFHPGDHASVFELDGVRCGAAICYDIRFPEWIRTICLNGIEVLFVAAQWPGIRREHWKNLNRTRAIENQCFVVAVNSCGTAGQTKYGGCSMAIDPWGDVLAQAGEEEQILTCELDREVIRRIRSEINVYRDRRMELYRVNREWGEEEVTG